MTKFKEYHFDVEIIIDYEHINIVGKRCKLSTHRMLRGLTLSELISLIKDNKIPLNYAKSDITFNIRGVNY